jgi:large subunit ribosomal protein L43
VKGRWSKTESCCRFERSIISRRDAKKPYFGRHERRIFQLLLNPSSASTTPPQHPSDTLPPAMPVSGIKAVAAARNGVGAFILPCRRLDLHYCDWAGSSRGLNTFLQSPLLEKLTKQYPQTEFRVSPRPHRHPVLKAYYINGKEKAICVRNLSREQVFQKAEILMNSSGLKNKKQRGKPVISGNEAVRGVWSPYHGGIKSI